MAFASVLCTDLDQTQWRGKDYKQQWNDYFAKGGASNLLDELEAELQEVNCNAVVDLAQTK